MKDITKKCRECHQVKPIDMFYKMKCGRVYNPCKPCKKKRNVSDPKYQRNYYQKNKEREFRLI